MIDEMEIEDSEGDADEDAEDDPEEDPDETPREDPVEDEEVPFAHIPPAPVTDHPDPNMRDFRDIHMVPPPLVVAPSPIHSHAPTEEPF